VLNLHRVVPGWMGKAPACGIEGARGVDAGVSRVEAEREVEQHNRLLMHQWH
jgi:hypothetical protein